MAMSFVCDGFFCWQTDGYGVKKETPFAENGKGVSRGERFSLI
jgi:hypothetical protein